MCFIQELTPDITMNIFLCFSKVLLIRNEYIKILIETRKKITKTKKNIYITFIFDAT